MKVSEIINKLTALKDEVGDIQVCIGSTVDDGEGEDRNITYEIDFVGNVFNHYIYLELGDECPEP